MEYIKTNELEHHGILGMKWGVRRFQNPDGSLTNAGKKRYQTVENAVEIAKKKAKFWENSANAEQKSIDAYSNKYSGNMKKYARDFGDPTMSESSAKRLFDADIKDMELNKQSMIDLAKDYIKAHDELMSLKVSDLDKGKIELAKNLLKGDSNSWEKYLKWKAKHPHADYSNED